MFWKKVQFWSKFPKNVDFFSEISKKFLFGQIFEKFRFGSNFEKKFNFVQIFQKFRF